MPKRRYLTDKEKSALYLERGGCCWNCGDPYPIEELEGEHYIPVAFGNEEKPDALWCRTCHKKKSAKDIKAIRKTQRLNGERPRKRRGRKLQSRGFEKGKRKW